MTRWPVPALRFFAAVAAYGVSLAVAYGLVMPSLPAVTTGEPVSPETAVLVVAVLNTMAVAWLVARARIDGWPLAATITLLFFGIQTLLSQLESLAFQAMPGYRRHLPVAIIPRIFLAGLVHALLWVPVAVALLRRRSRGPSLPAREAVRLLPRVSAPKLGAAAFAYVVLYFTFGYYVAWRDPAVRSYYQGSDPGSFWAQVSATVRDLPWLVPFQVVRGLVWTALGLLALGLLRAPRLEKGLALGTFFAVVMSASLLMPNPYMPAAVRMTHMVETVSSNFIFGMLLAALFGDELESDESRAAVET